MEVSFKKLLFSIAEDKISLVSFGSIAHPNTNFCEVHVCGENKNTHMGAKMANSSEGAKLRYLTHTLTENKLTVIQKSELVEVKTVFESFDSTDTVRIYSEIKNITDEPITIEEASSFVLYGIGKRGIDSSKEIFFTRFRQSHHAECQPQKSSLFDNGLYRANSESQKRLAHANIGSWSTKEELPQGIIEDTESGAALMFQIESSNTWYYEIADAFLKYYLYLGGGCLPFGCFAKELDTLESMRTESVAICTSGDVESVISEMTKYRRQTANRQPCDSDLPTIFNEYMHLSWDSPTEENTKNVAPHVAQLGIKYYVIDCGWHDEEAGNIIYPYVGKWKESNARFPHGIRSTTDYIRSLGMKAGLWIEPEIVGIKCKEMIEYYGEDAFLTRGGKKIAVMNRYFLDYRNEKVRSYMTETIRRMVEDYGADYIKFDYNEDLGVGTDKDATSYGDGLKSASDAFFAWVREMTERFADTVFEGCASGGMRMDAKTLSHFSLVSTSDQINYAKYPYIAANILSAVIPEQAAVWSYPVNVDGAGISVFDKDADWVKNNISDDKIAMNMINSLLGRMHLASHVDLLSEDQKALVKEGIEYYNSLADKKITATPHFPIGFAQFGDDLTASGFISEGRLYLAVWCLNGATRVTVPMQKAIKEAMIAYPKSSPVILEYDENSLYLDFGKTNRAVFIEATLKQ